MSFLITKKIKQRSPFLFSNLFLIIKYMMIKKAHQSLSSSEAFPPFSYSPFSKFGWLSFRSFSVHLNSHLDFCFYIKWAQTVLLPFPGARDVKHMLSMHKALDLICSTKTKIKNHTKNKPTTFFHLT